MDTNDQQHQLDTTTNEGLESINQTINDKTNDGDDEDKSVNNPSNASTTTQASTTNASSANAATAAASTNKVEILLKPVGNAPILKKKKFMLERAKNVKWLIDWLKKYMKLDEKEQLFLYVNQEFAPCLDTEIGTIFDCFGISNNIIFHYCLTPAWG